MINNMFLGNIVSYARVFQTLFYTAIIMDKASNIDYIIGLTKLNKQ